MQLLLPLFALFGVALACPMAYPVTNDTLARRRFINSTEELDTGGYGG